MLSLIKPTTEYIITLIIKRMIKDIIDSKIENVTVVNTSKMHLRITNVFKNICACCLYLNKFSIPDYSLTLYSEPYSEVYSKCYFKCIPNYSRSVFENVFRLIQSVFRIIRSNSKCIRILSLYSESVFRILLNSCEFVFYLLRILVNSFQTSVTKLIRTYSELNNNFGGFI